jgi:hypothetical protein
MDADDRLRLDYEQTTQLYRTLVDVRFRLLAVVPAIAGAAVAFVGRPRPAAELLGVGVIGFVATLGILVYELRNTEIHDAVVHRAQELERLLAFPSALDRGTTGGLFSERHSDPIRVLGVAAVARDRGLALVYGAALGGWGYLLAWGALRALGVGEARTIGAVLGLAVGLLVIGEVEHIGSRDRPGAAPRTRPA